MNTERSFNAHILWALTGIGYTRIEREHQKDLEATTASTFEGNRDYLFSSMERIFEDQVVTIKGQLCYPLQQTVDLLKSAKVDLREQRRIESLLGFAAFEHEGTRYVTQREVEGNIGRRFAFRQLFTYLKNQETTE